MHPRFEKGAIFEYHNTFSNWYITGVITSYDCVSSYTYLIIKHTKNTPSLILKGGNTGFHYNSEIARNLIIVGNMPVETAKVLYG